VDVRVRARSDVQVSDGGDAVEAVLKGSKCGGLWQEHEQSVETFV
jgi:hypothetical protein